MSGFLSPSRLHSRRDALRMMLGSVGAISSCGWLPSVANALADHGQRRRHCVLLWMSGGPSQTDTFDMKPGHANGGQFKEIATSVPGIRMSEHLPELAKQADHLSILRGVSTREGDHARGTYSMRTGRRPGTPIRFPSIGSAVAKELTLASDSLPAYVSVNPSPQINPDAFGPGFLGPKYAAATVGANGRGGENAAGFAELKVENLTLPQRVDSEQASRRIELWNTLQHGFLSGRASPATVAQDTVYRKALRLMSSNEIEGFDLTREPDDVRRAYGTGRFGQGCLIARRLIERGVPFVEVTLGDGLGWDTHQNNFEGVRRLSGELDKGWSMLMTELKERGLLESTTILWMGEFGRTPRINNMAGRDHFPTAWTCVFAGGGVQGGQVYGETSRDGMEVVDGKVAEADILATLCAAVGIDPETENVSELGRPHKISEGTPIRDLLS